MTIYASEQGDITLGLLGDVMLSRRLTPFREPGFLALRELLSNTDAAFANLETTVRRRDQGYPNFTQGTPMSTDPALLDDLRWLGIDFVSCANNHATDWGVAGVEAMIEHLRRARLPFAGVGVNLAEALAPAYVDTPAGRVGLVATTAFFRPWNRAASQRGDCRGRPGVNPLGFSTTYRVPDDEFAVLARLAAGLGLDRARRRAQAQFYSASELPADSAGRRELFGQNFEHGDRFGVSTVADAGDLAANLRAIREARRQADWVVASIHAHEFGGAATMTADRDADLEEPAAFVVEYARRAIDQGADLVVGHGPHLTLGVELYAGKPILYSLGNAVLQNDTVEVVPAASYARFDLGADATPADFFDARTDHDRKGFPATAEYWQGIAAVCRFADRRPLTLELHPLDLGHGRPRAQRGRPLLARDETAGRILERVRRLSRRHGAELVIDGAVARLDLG